MLSIMADPIMRLPGWERMSAGRLLKQPEGRPALSASHCESHKGATRCWANSPSSAPVECCLRPKVPPGSLP